MNDRLPVAGHPAAVRPAQTVGRSRRLHVLLWINVVLIIHGSLYPWRFSEPTSWHDAVLHFFDGQMWTGLGDVVGNVVLFMPLGALGVLCWRRPATRAAFFVASALFAFALQVLQVYVPSRDAVLSDMIWNTAGLGLGMLLSGIGSRFRIGPTAASTSLRAAPVALALLWLGLEWWPFVPTLDFQHVKDSLKPLLLTPQWNPRSAAEVAISVIVVGHVLRKLPHATPLLAAAVLASALAKLVIVGGSLSVSHTAGYLIGLVASWSMARLVPRSSASVVAALALAWFTFDELRPFVLSAQASPYHFIPFEAMLEGSMDANAVALMWDLFWIGAVMVPAVDLGAQPLPFALGLGFWVAMLEILQRWLPGRSADITPALLPLLWALMFPAMPGGSSRTRRRDRPGSDRMGRVRER